MTLTREQENQFVEDGYTGPVQILPSAEMERLGQRVFEDVIVESEGSTYTYGVHTNRDRHLTSRALFEIVTHPVLMSCLTQLLGPDVILWRTTAFYKPPAQGDPSAPVGFGEIDWHQGIDFLKPAVDTTGLFPSIGVTREDNLNELPLNVTCWFAIDEATEQSGTLIFVPGSQQLGVVPYVECSGGFHGMGLRPAIDGILDTNRAVIVPVEPGACLLFNNLVFHKSLPNTSCRRRLGVACRYVANKTPVYLHGDPTGFDLSRWACIQVAGRDVYGHNKIWSESDLKLFD